MNFYPHHLGDHARRSSHLCLLEEGALRRLLDLYYSREAALPAEVGEVCRLVRATSKPEREAVARMLREFFSLADDGWHQQRADAEIRKCQEKQAKARASAEARWSGSQASDRNANASPEHMRTHCDGNAKAMLPITKSQEPRAKRETKEPTGSSSPAKLPTCQTQAVIDVYHEVLPELPKVRLQTKDRVRAIQKAWAWVLTSTKDDQTRRAETAEEALQWFRVYFEHARGNDFLMGRTPRTGPHANWRCDLDFLLSDRGMKHVIEKTAITEVEG